jgi:ribosomal protein L11 methyltransferase
VLATDIDPEAVRVTRSNAALNSLGPLVCAKAAAGLHYPAIHARAPYDLIFANILARPLASMARGLAQLLSPGGTVVLSGLTREQLRWISACYRAHGLIPVQTVKIENWAALALRKPGTKTKRPGPNPGRYKVSSAAPGWEQDL